MKNDPILHLAPMYNITNRATRQIAKKLGCAVTWSEMISSEGLVKQDLKNNKSLILAEKFNETETPYWVQIFGSNPVNMAKAAQLVEKYIKPTGIDINLGCPVPKAKKAGYGAIQIKNIPKIVDIIKAIKQTIDLPLSLKTRLGLTDPTEILKFGPKLEKAGIDQLVIHARTLKGLFSEKPKWKIVKKLNDQLNVPVIYNGGIKTPEDAKFYIEKTGCQNLMIGQASIGNPWIFQEIKSFLKNEAVLKISLKEKKALLLEHAQLIIDYFGEKGLIGFRTTQLSAYMRTLQAPKKIRSQIAQITSISELEELLNSIN